MLITSISTLLMSKRSESESELNKFINLFNIPVSWGQQIKEEPLLTSGQLNLKASSFPFTTFRTKSVTLPLFVVNLIFSEKKNRHATISCRAYFVFGLHAIIKLLVKEHNISPDKAKNLVECVFRVVTTFIVLMYFFNHTETFSVFHAHFFLCI